MEAYEPAVKAALSNDKARIARALAEMVSSRLVENPEVMTFQEAVALERQNVAYWAGYHDHETRLAVEAAYDCEHPILGRAADGVPTMSECMAMGFAVAKEIPMQEVKALRLKWAAVKDLDAREAMVRKFLQGVGFYDKVRE